MTSSKAFRWLPADFVRRAHGEVIAEFGGSAGLRDAGLLESALARPRNAAAYAEEPPSPFRLAALYGVGLAKNHPFVDGNKRIAFYAIDAFLYLNGYVFEPDGQDAVIVMRAVASSEMNADELAGWIEASTRRR